MEELNVNTLKSLCKIKGIKNYSKLRKNELIEKLETLYSSLKIQKFIRSKLIKDQLCAISMEKIKYPCFPYCPVKGVFIYYNIRPLKEYLLSTGDFRDPNTRNDYTKEHLFLMDRIDPGYDSVYKASNNKIHYKKQKQLRDEVLTFERILDYITNDISKLIQESSNAYSCRLTLGTSNLPEYRANLIRLCARDKRHGEYILNKTITNLNILIERDYGSSLDPSDLMKLDLKDYVILYLYSLQDLTMQ
jgi:hypothetical protein